jgi:hypothetical protein
MPAKAEVIITVEPVNGGTSIKLTLEEARKLRDELTQAINSVTPPRPSPPSFDRY